MIHEYSQTIDRKLSTQPRTGPSPVIRANTKKELKTRTVTNTDRIITQSAAIKKSAGFLQNQCKEPADESMNAQCYFSRQLTRNTALQCIYIITY